MKQPGNRSILCAFALLFFAGMAITTPAADDSQVWPAITSQTRPWTYWWWMGSAVDRTNLTRELQRYHDAGLGGVHIIPIYGAKGCESNYVSYLSPKWMEMLGYTVSEAHRLGLGVDMTIGTGWCFGGPDVSDRDANASVVVKTFDLAVGEKLKEKFKRNAIQALVAFSPDGKSVELTDKISADGEVDWTAPGGTWRVYAISQKPSGQKVKRAAPGGEGWMLNPFYPPAMSDYLRRFTDAFANYDGPKPRAMYQDSYEYKSDWSPDFFTQFEKRRGYKLQTELPALFGTNQDDHAARVKSDYRETISDIMTEESEPLWVAWSHERGFITRYQAHGSPGNLLDLYALADIPETEMFHTNQNPLVSKFASSAAHVKGGNLVAAETGTWLAEHFTETLGEMKSLVDNMFLSGINHVFYHGTCYSPDEAGWPGWLFYASTEMNPRNSIWRDAPALNDYVARCQSILQSGKPDNDILLYWPIYDYWNDPTSQLPQLKIESQQIWFENQPIGKTAHELWNRGYAFDYVSDRQLQGAKVEDGKIQMPGGNYKVIVVPECKFMPLETFKKLLALVESGAKVVMKNPLQDVSGWGNLENRRAKFKELLAKINKPAPSEHFASMLSLGKGVIIGGAGGSPWDAGAEPEEMTRYGLSFVRRSFDGGWNYFIANRSDKPLLSYQSGNWFPISVKAKSVIVMDPMTGQTGVAKIEQRDRGQTWVSLALEPGESVILRAFAEKKVEGPTWFWWSELYQIGEIKGNWHVSFISGGPTLPQSFTTTNLGSWTNLGDTNAQSFAGTVKYEITFDVADIRYSSCFLDLGDVRQSARLKVNGKDYGALITPPFRVFVDNLKPKDNKLEVEVTSVAANRIRDLDRRGVPWKTFRDINIVDINYKPFDASNWPLTDCGLLGPVTLTVVRPFFN